MTVGGGGGVCSEATTFLARTSGITGADATAYTNFICGLVTDGLWTKFDLLYTWGAPTATDGRLNMKSTSFTATVVGSPTFTAYQGYTGASGAHLDTNWDPFIDAVQFTQDSAHVAYRANNEIGPETAYSAGSWAGGGTSTNLISSLSGSMFSRMNDATGSGGIGSNALSKGFFVGNRSGASATQAYLDAVSIGTGSTASGGISDGHGGIPATMWAMDANSSTGLPNLPSVNQYSLFSVGASLSSSDVTAFNARVATLATALGWP